MTLEQVLECDAATLKKLTTEQLTAHFSKYFNVTRPELAPKPDRQKELAQIDPKLKAKVELANSLGLDLSYLLNKKRKGK